jgi:hypothetical protein
MPKAGGREESRDESRSGCPYSGFPVDALGAWAGVVAAFFVGSKQIKCDDPGTLTVRFGSILGDLTGHRRSKWVRFAP